MLGWILNCERDILWGSTNFSYCDFLFGLISTLWLCINLNWFFSETIGVFVVYWVGRILIWLRLVIVVGWLLIMKKSVAHKKSKGSSPPSFITKRFVSADVEARFHYLVKMRAKLKERGFEINSSHLAYFETIITQRGWQEFCKPPKVAAMTLVHEFYVNLITISTVQERHVKYDTVTINALLKIQTTPHSPDQVA